MVVRLLLLLLWLSSAVPALAGDDTATLLARAKTASGGAVWDTVFSLTGQGQMKAAGLDGSVETREDLATGRSVARYKLGLYQGADGYDGKVSWTLNPGGEVGVQDAPEALREARTAAWLSQRGYWYAQRGAAQLQPAQAREEAGRHYQVIRATPAGGEAVELWFGRDSHLLERTVTGLDKPEHVVTQLSDWREVAGLRLPFRIVVDRGGDAANRVEIVYAGFSAGAALADADFAVPQHQGGAHIVDATGVTRIPFRLVRDHIHIKVEVDGKPLQMLVDTGGVNILLPAAVQKLGLQAEGQMVAQGAGEKSTEVRLAKAASLRLGGVLFEQPLFYVIDFGQIAAMEGEDFDGVIGYELFQRFGVVIDYAAQELVLSTPEKFVKPANARAVPFTLGERIPIIQGEIDGVPARISIDTGSGAAIDLHSPFVAKHGLKQRYGATFEALSGWGVGGPVRAWPVRLGQLDIGGFALPDVAASLYTGTKGAFAKTDVDANIGGRVLGRFTVAFDYANKTMYLAPNASYAQPFRSDRSGLALLREADVLKVYEVLAGSPAEQAGLKRDDRILRIGDVAVSTRSLSQWRDLLSDGAAQTPLDIAYERGGKAHTTRIALRDLIPLHGKPAPK